MAETTLPHRVIPPSINLMICNNGNLVEKFTILCMTSPSSANCLPQEGGAWVGTVCGIANLFKFGIDLPHFSFV